MSSQNFPFPTENITEGSVALTVPKLSLFAKGSSEYIPSKAPVFYNPRMELNRDIAVLVLRVYQKKINKKLHVCDPLTGCGVRGLRFAQEVEGVDQVILNDISSQAAGLANFNTEKNGLTAKVVVENADARALLGSYASHEGFNVIDLDPYGSPSPFIDSALIALKNRGLLALTATDTAPLCGVNPNVCLRKYHGKPLRTEYCHELALRLLLNLSVISAARYDLGVDILFSHSTDHYVRVYMQIRHGAKRADEALERVGYILHCFHCLNRKWILGFSSPLDTKCEVCGGAMSVAGPLWLGKLADRDFCSEMYKEANKIFPEGKSRLLKLLEAVLAEADMPPTYFIIDKICEKMGLSTAPRNKIVEKLIELGYKTIQTHFNAQAIKSEASIPIVKEAINEITI